MITKIMKLGKIWGNFISLCYLKTCIVLIYLKYNHKSYIDTVVNY